MANAEELIAKLAAIELQRADGLWIERFFSALAPLLTAILVAFVVHNFTRRRDREKAVFDCSEKLIELILAASKSANERWTTEDVSERRRLIQEVTWRIHQVGMVAEQLRQQSGYYRMSFSLSRPFILNCPVDLKKPMISFRQEITLKDFDDENSGPKPESLLDVERSSGKLVIDITKEMGRWQAMLPCQ